MADKAKAIDTATRQDRMISNLPLPGIRVSDNIDGFKPALPGGNMAVSRHPGQRRMFYRMRSRMET
jgi:hypothetical protein